MEIIETSVDRMENDLTKWFGHVTGMGGSGWPFDLVAGRKKDKWKTRKIMRKGSDKEERSRRMQHLKAQGTGKYGEQRLRTSRPLTLESCCRLLTN